MYKLVLIRHGESTWNLENRFTGWTDVDLTPTGVAQAKSAGQLLKAEGYEFDIAFTSVDCPEHLTLYSQGEKRLYLFMAASGTVTTARRAGADRAPTSPSGTRRPAPTSSATGANSARWRRRGGE